MSLFFDYFRKTLRFPLIWKAGPLSALVQGAALALDKAREDILASRVQAMPETCDADRLDLIGAGRGVRQWPQEPDDFYRERIRAAYEFFMLGGRRSGLEEIIRRAGGDVEIWEPRDVKTVLAAAGTPILDGSWNVDGGISLKTAQVVAGLPYLAWAEFCVRINLAGLREEWRHDFIKRLVYEYKPARSLPKFVYFMDLGMAVTHEVDSRGAMAKDTSLKPVSCQPCVDGSWRIGRDPERIRLDGSWNVDGFFSLSQVLMPAVAEKQIRDCRIGCGGSGGSSARVWAGHKSADPKVPYFSLYRKQRIVDGSWAAGSLRKLDGAWRLNQGSLAVPKLGKHPVFTLNSTRKVGYREPVSESWPAIGGSIYGSSDINSGVQEGNGGLA